MSRIEADYWIESAWPLAEAAEAMAGEQSSGTFLPIPGETPELKERSAARVTALDDLGPVEAPSLPGAGRADQPHRAGRVTLSWPLDNMGPSLPNLIAAVAGNLFELKQFSGLRLTDLRLPEEFADANPGPAFGIDGTRRLAGVETRPLIGTIVKPSVGLDAAGTAALVADLAEAGLDFVKDDELQGDGPACPFEDRARAVMGVVNRAADRSGQKLMFAFNITGEIDEMKRRHDLVLELGGTCVMVNLTGVGLSGFLAIRRHAGLPIHAHRNGWGALSRCPSLGFDYAPWARIWRLAGADHMHVNGLCNKFCEPDDSVIRSARSMLEPMFSSKPCTVMPVFSSGQSAAQVWDTYAALGSSDLIYAAGGGIMGHPRRTGGGRRRAARGLGRGAGRRKRRRPCGALARARRSAGQVRLMRPLPETGPVLAWYGDDFTGSGAVMEVLTFAGLPAVLFLEPPTPDMLAAFPQARAIGLASDARTRDPEWMRATLPQAFASLRAFGAPLLHYKICSTLDSAPLIGSIGAAAEIGGAPGKPIPLIVAAPGIGRWQAFGNLFARAGDGIHRLDRHPTMSRHPVTPMDEADVPRHIARQTTLPVGLIDLLDLKAGHGAERLAAQTGIVAIDVVDDETLAVAGALIWEAGAEFVIGSQGIEYALAAAWAEAGLIAPPPQPATLAPTERIGVVSGSCSPITAEQIVEAGRAGFKIIDIDPRAADWQAALDAAAGTALTALRRGRSPLVATARGAGDAGVSDAGGRIGAGLGRLLDRLVREAGLTRAVIAGGDTSSAAARGLGIVALTAETPIAPGAALLRGRRADGSTIEIAMKGGQMGGPDFFVRARDGHRTGGAAAA